MDSLIALSKQVDRNVSASAVGSGSSSSQSKKRSREHQSACTNDSPKSNCKILYHTVSRAHYYGAIFPDPYHVDVNDHCETPIDAYRHILPYLELLREKLGYANDSELRIYDPYYCQGHVVERLGELGFPNVYNRKEDFYTMIATPR